MSENARTVEHPPIDCTKISKQGCIESWQAYTRMEQLLLVLPAASQKLIREIVFAAHG